MILIHFEEWDKSGVWGIWGHLMDTHLKELRMTCPALRGLEIQTVILNAAMSPFGCQSRFELGKMSVAYVQYICLHA